MFGGQFGTTTVKWMDIDRGCYCHSVNKYSSMCTLRSA